MANMTPQEQLMLELVNRARMDPIAEAARYGVALTAAQKAVKQALAGNDKLAVSTDKHSAWMLQYDTFSHQETPSKPTYFTGVEFYHRMTAAGYGAANTFTGAENIALMTQSSAINATAAILSQHAGLFRSAGHRTNILNNAYDELGVGQNTTLKYGTSFASAVTENFGNKAGSTFITGVVYNDTVKDDFFTVGEQTVGRSVTSVGATSDTTGGGGGYELSFAGGGVKTVNFNLATGQVRVQVTLGTTNVKVDVVNGHEVWSNAPVTTAVSANITEMHALGISALTLTGGTASEKIFGNKANNILNGGDGHDTFFGGAGRDVLTGGTGIDRFSFRTASESPANSGRDIINDFQDSSGDKIDFSALSAGVLGYRGGLGFSGANQVRVQASGADVLVSVNLDADATPELQVMLKGTTLASMAATDFIL